MVIRKATLEDIPFIKECLIDSWVEHARNNPSLMIEARMRQSKVEEYYSYVINNDKGYVLIAETDDKKVGLIRAYETKLADFFKDPQILYVDDVYVLKEYRRQGIARVLYMEIEKLAKEKGIKRIDGRIYTYNKPMQKLLENMNYHMPYSTWVKILE